MADLTSESFWDKSWVSKKGAQSNRLIMSFWETRQMVKKILAQLPASPHSIELGCAPGSNIMLYHTLAKDMVMDGIDISEVGLKAADELMREHKIKGSLHKDDIRSPSEGLKEKYDLVFSHGLIEHFDDYAGILKEHYKFAKPGGLIFIPVPNYAHPLIKSFLQSFSKKTLETHNLDVMQLQSLRAAASDPSVEIVEVGSYGGPLIPHCNPDPGWRGVAYRFLARAWNFSLSLLSLVGLRKWMLGLWDLHLFVLVRKKRH
jgi:SAM-dependent methyltransferase